MPGYRFQYQVPPTSAALSINRMLCTPSSRNRAPVSSPPKPAPMIATSTSSDSGSRVKCGSAPRIVGKSSKRPSDFDVLRTPSATQSPVPFKGIFLPQSIYVECHAASSTRHQLRSSRNLEPVPMIWQGSGVLICIHVASSRPVPLGGSRRRAVRLTGGVRHRACLSSSAGATGTTIPVPPAISALPLPVLPMPAGLPPFPYPAGVPTVELPSDIPAVQLPAAIPDIQVPADVPAVQLPADIPPIQLPADIPSGLL